MRECATVGKLLEKVWSHPLPPPTARPSGTAAAEHEKGKQFSFTGGGTPAAIFFLLESQTGGEGTPLQGGLIFTPRITIFFRGKNVQSVTSLKNAKPEKTRILKKFIMQALDLYGYKHQMQALVLYSHQIRLLGRTLRPLHVKHVKTDSEYPISILSDQPTKKKKTEVKKID